MTPSSASFFGDQMPDPVQSRPRVELVRDDSVDGNIVNIQADGAIPGFKRDFRDGQPREVFHFPPDIRFLIWIIDLHCFRRFFFIKYLVDQK